MDPADRAPEVVFNPSDDSASQVAHSLLPILSAKENGGLEVIDCLPPEVNESSFSSSPRDDCNTSGVRSPRLRNIILGCGSGTLLLLLLAVGLGVGLGISSASAHKSTLTQSGSAATAPGTQQVSPTSKVSPLTSGSNGIAVYSCNDSTPHDIYSTPHSTEFREECHIVYRTGTQSYNSSINVSDISKLTVYSFESCMDHCAAWNADMLKANSSGLMCGAVSYNANLTFAVNQWNANCFLKTTRAATPYTGTQNENYSLVGSAYVVQQ